MKKILSAALSLALYVCLVNPASVFAATDWENLSEDEFIKTANEVVYSAQNIKVESTNVGYIYKKMGDKKPLFYLGTTVTGTFYKAATSSSLTVSSSTITFETGKTKPKEFYSMAVISDGHYLYFKPDGLKYKPLRNKWIKATSSQYSKIGYGLGVSSLFEVFDTTTDKEMRARSKKISDAQSKTELWLRYDEIIEDDISVPHATRYNFEFYFPAIEPYFKELTKVLTLEEAGYGLLSSKNFIKQLSDEEVTDFIGINSYMSVWIDDITNKPARMVSATWIPITERNKTTYILEYVDTKISGYDMQPKLQIPATSTDAVTAAKFLKIKLGS